MKHALTFLTLCAERGLCCSIVWRESAFILSWYPGEQRVMEEAQ